MNMNKTSPIVFNALKHHKGFIQIFTAQGNTSKVFEDLVKIGGSQMDLYIGQLSIDTIMEDIIAFLKEKDLFEKDKYKAHLAQKSGYFECPISDGSTWTLRWGIHLTQYIHIHPSRYTLHTVRVKAGILKTAIAFLCLNSSSFSTEIINNIRIKLSLSPIKNVEESNGILKMVEILSG